MEVARSQKASANEILNSFVGIAGRKEAEFRVPHQGTQQSETPRDQESFSLAG